MCLLLSKENNMLWKNVCQLDIKQSNTGPNIIQLISEYFTLNFSVSPHNLMRATPKCGVNYTKISFITQGPGLSFKNKSVTKRVSLNCKARSPWIKSYFFKQCQVELVFLYQIHTFIDICISNRGNFYCISNCNKSLDKSF